MRLLLALLAAALAFPLQTPAPTHPTSTPYAGDLSIFETPGRAERLHIDRVMDLLNLTPGKPVADIGAGGGWFSVLAARRVGPKGVVLAEDINPYFIDSIRKRADKVVARVTVKQTYENVLMPVDVMLRS